MYLTHVQWFQHFTCHVYQWINLFLDLIWNFQNEKNFRRTKFLVAGKSQKFHKVTDFLRILLCDMTERMAVWNFCITFSNISNWHSNLNLLNFCSVEGTMYTYKAWLEKLCLFPCPEVKRQLENTSLNHFLRVKLNLIHSFFKWLLLIWEVCLDW